MSKLILAAIGLIVVVIGLYVFLAEKKMRKAHEDTRNPWTKR